MPKQLQWTSELVQTFWSGVGQSRLSELSFSRLAGASMLAVLEPHLDKSMTILDFGAGDGDFTRLLIESGYKVAVLEPSEGRRQVMRKQSFTQSPNFLGFAEDSHKGTFDAVVMLEVIEHIPDQAMSGVLKSISDFLKPGGKVLVSTPHMEDLDLASAYCPVCDHMFHRWQHQQSWTSDRLKDTLASAGFACSHLYFTDFSAYGALKQELEDLRQQHEKLMREHLLLEAKKLSFGHGFFACIKGLLMHWARMIHRALRSHNVIAGPKTPLPGMSVIQKDGYTEIRGPVQAHLVFIGTKKA